MYIPPNVRVTGEALAAIILGAGPNFFDISAPRAVVQVGKPGETGYKQVPINRMGPRSFITNIRPGDKVHAQAPTSARGIAFGGDAGVARVDFSADGGKTWQEARLGPDQGKYSFRRWQAEFTVPARGQHALMVRCTSSAGMVQPSTPVWNPSGFMQNVIETTPVTAI